MGIFGVLTGFEQLKAAGNAILANHLLTNLSNTDRREIVAFVAKGYNRSPADIIGYLNSIGRIEQLNCVAIACVNLNIKPILNDGIGWRYMKNPKSAMFTKLKHIKYIIEDTEKRSCTKIEWPGDETKLNFSSWYADQANVEHQQQETSESARQRKIAEARKRQEEDEIERHAARRNRSNEQARETPTDGAEIDAALKRGHSAKPQRGEDVTKSVCVPLGTSKLGGFARVELLSGRKFDVKVPVGLRDGAQIRLRGAGMPGLNGGASGDVLISLKIGPT